MSLFQHSFVSSGTSSSRSPMKTNATSPSMIEDQECYDKASILFSRQQLEADGGDDDKSINHSVPFPWKLHEMLEAAEKEDFMSIVSWLPDSTSFKVYRIDVFVRDILPIYFRQTKYKSFQRQCKSFCSRFHPSFTRRLRGVSNSFFSCCPFVMIRSYWQ